MSKESKYKEKNMEQLRYKIIFKRLFQASTASPSTHFLIKEKEYCVVSLTAEKILWTYLCMYLVVFRVPLKMFLHSFLMNVN